MIKILIQPTHSKIIFDNTKVKETLKAEDILTTHFSSVDTSMNHNPLVKKGILSNIKSFWNEEYQLLPSGFIEYLKFYFDKAKVDYEIIDGRKLPKINKQVLKDILKDEFEVNGYIPFPHQRDCIHTFFKYIKESPTGIASSPTGSGKCLSGDTEIEIQVDEKLRSKLKEKNKTVKIKIKDLFETISTLEEHEFITDEPYIQKSKIKIKNEKSEWKNVPALIKKKDSLIELTFDNQQVVSVGSQHRLIVDKDNKKDSFAKNIKLEDEVIKADNSIVKVIKKSDHKKISDVFDLQIDSENPYYQTADGFVHHNSFMLALFAHVFSSSKILLLFPDIGLTHQTRTAFLDFGFDESELGIVQGPNCQDDRRITFLCVPSYQKLLHMFPYYDVVLVDECHSLGSGIMGESQSTKVLYMMQNATIRIGVSATPEDIDNPYRQMALHGNLGAVFFKEEARELMDQGRLADITVELHEFGGEDIPMMGSYQDIYDYKIFSVNEFHKDMEEAGYEVDGNFFVVDKKYPIKYKKNLVPRELEEYQKLLEHYGWDCKKPKEKWGKLHVKRFKEFGDESLLYVHNKKRNELVAKLARSHDRCIILVTKLAHCDNLSLELPEAVLVHGKHDTNERDLAKQHLLKKDSIVVATNVWRTGVDIKWAETIIDASGGKGTIKVIQGLGRGTRINEDTGKFTGTFIDVVGWRNPIEKAQSDKRIRIYTDRLKLKIKEFFIGDK